MRNKFLTIVLFCCMLYNIKQCCSHLDQHSHLHLPLALLKLHKKSDYKLKCRFCSTVGSANSQPETGAQNKFHRKPRVMLLVELETMVIRRFVITEMAPGQALATRKIDTRLDASID